MRTWPEVIRELLGLFPALVDYLRQRSWDSRQRLDAALKQREEGWKNENAGDIFNGPRPSVG